MLAGLQNVTIEFGARTIVRDATWHIQAADRTGLIGYNGTGKSTLLKLLAGEFQPSAGTVERGRNTTIGFLHQDLLGFDTDESILQVALHAFDRVILLEQELENLLKRIEKDNSEDLLHEYSDKLHQFGEAGGYEVRHRTGEVLQGLGFGNEDLERPYREFSGGWRMRVLLAKMILQQPDLLLLDEPTNHLDLPSIEWLEKYLQHYKGAVVIVSHDKFFLDRMVRKIVELYQKELHFYNGNYSFYETEKQQRIEMQQRAYENQQEFIRQQQRFIERFRAKASKAAQAQSVMKRLEKLDRIEDASPERPDIRINFTVDKSPGRTLVALKGISKNFGENIILENASAEIDRGDKIALIGANGRGKSTLLRIIAGTESFRGERKWGHQVEEAFYAQHQLEMLDPGNTILDEVKTAGVGKTELELRTLLGCFLFSGDDVEKKIRILSGGEKARVALAKTILSRANFLLLDEPTNHLDIHSTGLLIDALNRYQGSYILVSHDRYFISRTANKIWEITDHQIKEFSGGYTEYVAWKQRMEQQSREEKSEPAPEMAANNKSANTAQMQQDRNAARKELQKLRRQFQKAEQELSDLQNRKSELEQQLSSPEIYADGEKFKSAEAEYRKVTDEFDRLNIHYEQLFEKILSLEQETAD